MRTGDPCLSSTLVDDPTVLPPGSNIPLMLVDFVEQILEYLGLSGNESLENCGPVTYS